MTTAKFETRKLNLIEMIIKLKDDDVVSEVENILLHKLLHHHILRPMLSLVIILTIIQELAP